MAAMNDPDLLVNVIAGGAHMLKQFGHTIDNVRSDGYLNIQIVNYLNEDDNTDTDIAMAYRRAVDAFVAILKVDPPDFVFILGDRWEMLAVASAASLLRIPIAHHSGGDITQGSLDNQNRYVITSFSHLHFVSLPQHKERLIRMGEERWRVSVTGEPALTMLHDYDFSKTDFRSELNLSPKDKFVLATFHPTTYENQPLIKQINLFVEALDLIKNNIILTAPNADPGCGLIITVLSEYARKRNNVHLFENLGIKIFYAAMVDALFMIGNSSSGAD